MERILILMQAANWAEATEALTSARENALHRNALSYALVLPEAPTSPEECNMAAFGALRYLVSPEMTFAAMETLWHGERYALLAHPAMRFERDWEKKLLRALNDCQVENAQAVLTGYLPAQDDTRIAEVDATKMSPEIISEFLAKGSSKEVYNFVESYLQSISEVIHSVIFRDYVVLNIRFTAIAFMERNGVTKEEFLAHIGKYGTNVHVQQDEVFEYFLSILQTAIDLRDEQNTNLSSKTLKKALAYIDEHYTSENLSLGTVACEVQVGANYLSSVFSQNMQKTFTEYISEKRMEKAKKLLKSTELPTSEIAAQVGYKDPHYFSFVFKKTQGCSPREYRSSI